jgi:hypothetical protein
MLNTNVLYAQPFFRSSVTFYLSFMQSRSYTETKLKISPTIFVWSTHTKFHLNLANSFRNENMQPPHYTSIGYVLGKERMKMLPFAFLILTVNTTFLDISLKHVYEAYCETMGE